MQFVDYVTITARSGKGGAGCIAFRREKFVPKGGPSGGNGGKGGSVFLEADPHLYTLLDLRYKRHHFAPHGRGGEGSNKAGKDGADLILRVPPGTLARLTGKEAMLGEVLKPGNRLLLARGGRGGKGNAFFKSATRQVPRYAQPGEAGEEKEVTLELRLLADVGLVGFPNAGKSTLVASVSAARPKIADYPFTTIAPSLGTVYVRDFESFVIADIPGIIPGAHQGKGLGIQFLKHIERNAILLFVIPVTSENPKAEYDALLDELYRFNPAILYKPRMVVFSKADLLSGADPATWLRQTGNNFPEDTTTILISGATHYGLENLKQVLWGHIQQERRL